MLFRSTAAGGLHRLWLNLTAMFENGDEAAVERVDEGEEYLAGKFDAALENDDLDPQTCAVIERGRAEVREGERLAGQSRDGRPGSFRFGRCVQAASISVSASRST